VNAQAALKNYSSVKVDAAIEGANPHQLIQMLFDGLLERIAQMKGAMEQKNIELKSQKVNQAVDILFGLRDSLNLEQPTDLSLRLDSLYEYIQNQLRKAHQSNNAALLDECTTLIAEVSSGWRDMGEQQK